MTTRRNPEGDVGQNPTSAAAGAWQRRAVVRDSRLFTRSLIVVGTLGLVFAWRVDRAINTAYNSQWVAPNTDGLRLPTQTWSWFYAGIGAVSVVLLLGAALLWRRRERGAFFQGELGNTSIAISALVGALASGTAVARWLAADGNEGALTAAVVLNLLALSAVAALALATANLVYGGLTSIVKGVFRRQRANLVVVLALTAGLMFLGQTSGQSIDSIRSWTPLVFDGNDVTWSRLGAARLTLGLAAALLLALVVYEAGVRLTQTRPSLDEPPVKGTLRIGAALSVIGLLLLVALPFGPGLLLLGLGLLLVGALELPKLHGSELARMTPTPAEVNAPEWIAITPLFALAATSVTATVEAAISGGWDLNALMTAAPALVLGALAVLLTRRAGTPTRTIEGVTPMRLWGLASVLVGASLLVLFVKDLSLAALYGLFWLAFLTYYAWRLFSNRPLGIGRASSTGAAQPAWRAYTVAFALSGGLTAFIGIHVEPLEAGHLLGVFTLALVALALAIPLLRILVDLTLRLRPPRLLWWFGFNQLPILTLLLIWWIAVGIAQTHYGPTKSLHDVRLVERTAAGLAPTAATTPTLERYFDEWVDAQPDRNLPAAAGPLPLVLVAAHGGGIRAAYWTVAALDCIVGVSADGFDPGSLDSSDESAKASVRDEACSSRRRTTGEQQAAARRIFMASGVSGGAVGLYAYARQLLQNGELGTTPDWVNERLGDDFASPAIGWALFHDFPNRLFGFHPDVGAPCGWKLLDSCLRQDRAAVLEKTFDDKWDKGLASAALVRRSYDLRFSESAEERENARLLPLLVLNATMTGGKARAVISAANLGSWPAADADDPERGNDRLPLAGTVEIRDALCESKDLRLSTAALLAGRFPYVTPSGRIPGRCGYEGKLRSTDQDALCARETERRVRCEGRFVDGGYTDNSGLFTMVAVWPSLRALIVDYNLRARASGRRELAPMIVELDNHYHASLLSSVPSGGSAAETLIPPQTAFGARSAIETFARAAAYRILPTSCTVTISPALHPGLIAPLGWELSDSARDDLRSGLTKPHPADTTGMQAARLLRQIQARLAAPGEGKVVIREPLERCLPQLPHRVAD